MSTPASLTDDQAVELARRTNTLPRFLVTLATPDGPGSIEVPTLLGPDAAARRALWSAAAKGWGDVTELQVLGVVDITPPPATTENDCDSPWCAHNGYAAETGPAF